MQGPSESRKFSPKSSVLCCPVFPDSFCRDTIGTVTQGRVICRLVSMFQSIEELVEESDRRRTLELDDTAEDEAETPSDIQHTFE